MIDSKNCKDILEKKKDKKISLKSIFKYPKKPKSQIKSK